MSVKKTKLVAFLAAATLTLSACGGETTDGETTENTGGETTSETSEGPSGEIRAAAAYVTTNFHPSNTSSAFAFGTNLHVVEGLYEIDYTTFEAYPALAAGEPTEVGELTYEVTLREGAAFSDGTPVTTADVVASYDRIVNGEEDATGSLVTSPYAAFISFIDTFEAKDEQTVTITLAYPMEYLTERLANVKVVPADSTFDENTQQPIGTGPYKYEEIVTETSATVVPNEHYTGPKPATVERIHWTSETDDGVRVTAAVDGSVDIVENVDPQGAQMLEGQGWVVEEATGYGIAMAMFNTTAAPFDNATVRQAVLQGIDTQTIIDTTVGGMGVEADSALPSTSPAYKKAETSFAYDPEAAAAKLAEAGVSGEEITVLTTDHTWISGMGPQIQQNLEALGFTVNLQTLSSGDLWNNNVANGDFDLVIAPGDPSTFGADPGIFLKGWFYADLFMVDRYRIAESDPAGYEELKTLMAEAEALTGDEGKAKWGEVQDLIAEQAGLFPLFYHTILTAYNPETVEGVSPIGTPGLQLLETTAKIGRAHV